MRSLPAKPRCILVWMVSRKVTRPPYSVIFEQPASLYVRRGTLPCLVSCPQFVHGMPSNFVGER